MTRTRNQCKQCGTCCRKGGPLLHREDLPLVTERHIPYENLVTIRKGEPVQHPLRPGAEPADREMIKLAGQGGSWMCHFLEAGTNHCRIYADRPLECRMLKCWDTGDLEKIIGRDTVDRRDILGATHPLISFISAHDEDCPYEKVYGYISELGNGRKKTTALAGLTRLAQRDIKIRESALARFNLSVDLELFFFGRPLFMAIQSLDLQILEHHNELRITGGGNLTRKQNSAHLSDR